MKTRPWSCSERERSKISWMTCCPGRSAGWALPANTTWTGRFSFQSSRCEPVDIAEEQAGPLVGREAAGEADREDVRIERRLERIEDDRCLAVAGELVPETAPREDRQLELLALVGLPQLVGRQLVQPLPEAAALTLRVEVVEVRPEAAGQRLAHRVADPARHVDAVRDADDLPRRRLPARSRPRSRRGAG